MKKIIIIFLFMYGLVSAQSTYQTHIYKTLWKNLPQSIKTKLQEKDTAVLNIDNQTVKIYRRHFLPGNNSLGVKIFSPQFYQFFQKEILQMIEREVAHFLFLPEREWNEYSKTEKIFFYTSEQSFASKKNILEAIDAPRSVNVMQVDENFNIELKNSKDKKVIISFPGSYTFITGLDRIKLQEELLTKLQTHEFSGIPYNKDESQLKKRGELWVHEGKSFLIPQLNNNIYYNKQKELLYDTKLYLRESTSNLLLTGLSEKYDRKLKVYYFLYGEKQEFDISLKKFLSYFGDGFEKYFGIEDFNDHSVRGTLILKHPALSYIHMMDVRFEPANENKKEKMTAYFYAFIPQNEIKDFFGTDK